MLSAECQEKSRRYHSLVLQRVTNIGQGYVAEQIGLSVPTVSRFFADDLERACQVLAALGLKVVPGDMKCYPAEEIEAIFTLARTSMNKMGSVEKLSFE